MECDIGHVSLLQNGGDYDFILGEKAALPLDATFWDYLLSSSKKEWHLLVYEQDWLYVEFSDVNQLQVRGLKHWPSISTKIM